MVTEIRTHDMQVRTIHTTRNAVTEHFFEGEWGI
jgi:hypothetical protein